MMNKTLLLLILSQHHAADMNVGQFYLWELAIQR